ncbi:RlpA-like double-psi beta-barrel-protein domain-containing protein-containing protein [Mycena sanguinolenta]|nr:RlpA-like double-psi beta-barrel-protein domain-containing protein-containing protein [Mycena sanguinolenta]
MFSFAVLALAAASAGAHSISHVRRHHVPRQQPPAGWATGYLEPYNTYHERYLEIGCENKHDTPFFDLCCHPLLSSPAAAPATTTAAPADGGDDEGDDEDCDDDDDNTGDDEDCDCDDEGDDDDNDDDDCEDDGEGSDEPPAYTATTNKVAPSTEATHAVPTTTSTTVKRTTSTPTTSTKSVSTGDKSTPATYVTGGVGTWYMQDNEAGACGHWHSDSDFVVALQTKTYDEGMNCGRGIQICDLTNNKCVNGIVADECPSCNNPESVDMSRGMFQQLASLGVGEFKIKWTFTS